MDPFLAKAAEYARNVLGKNLKPTSGAFGWMALVRLSKADNASWLPWAPAAGLFRVFANPSSEACELAAARLLLASGNASADEVVCMLGGCGDGRSRFGHGSLR